MSTAWNIALPARRTSMATSDGFPSPPSVWSDSLHSRSNYFSSPPRSSSPPTSPMTSYSHFDSARIQSSPLASDYKTLGNAIGPRRGGIGAAQKPAEGKITLPSFRTMFGGDDLPPLTTSSTSSGYYADDSMMDTDEMRESVDPQGYDSVFFSDEEEGDGMREDEEEEDEITGLAYRRTSYFQTSAERGRWRYEPVVPRSAAHQPRKSEPSITIQAVEPPSSFARPASEPAPATVAPPPFLLAQPAAIPADDSQPESPSSPIAEAAPSLSISREVDIADFAQIDDPMTPSSPVLPPTSTLSQPELDPVSPLSLSHQSDAASAAPEESREEGMALDLETAKIPDADFAMTESVDLTISIRTRAEASLAERAKEDNMQDENQPASPDSSPLSPASRQSLSATTKTNADGPSKVPVGDKENHVHDILPCPAKRTKSRSPMLACDSSTLPSVSTPPLTDRKDVVVESMPAVEPTPAKDEARELAEELFPDFASSSEKRKTDDAESGPLRKRSRQTLSPAPEPALPTVPERAASPLSDDEEVPPPPKKSTKSRTKRRPSKFAREVSAAATSDGEADEPAPKPQRPRAKRRTTLEKLSDTTFADQPSLPPSTYKRARASPLPPPVQQGPHPDDEARGLLIQSMAASRASSQTLTVLRRAVLEACPHLLEKQAEDAWHAEFAGVLERGAQEGGLFGKVESSYQGDGSRAMEAQWFYVPERDPDQERAGLMKMMFPRLAKRSETKKYKQYYYAPLARINKWDPEDAL